MADAMRSNIEAGIELTLPVLAAVGVLTILWGVLCAGARLLSMEWRRLQGKEYLGEAKEIRQHLGYYLLLGLEFLIAVDAIETLLNPDWKELGVLASLVVLRTLMSFTLHWELREEG